LAAFAADTDLLPPKGKPHRLRLSGEWTAAHAADI
jgi:hypothetical protein